MKKRGATTVSSSRRLIITVENSVEERKIAKTSHDVLSAIKSIKNTNWEANQNNR